MATPGIRSVLAMALLLLCAGCKTPAPAPREPVDLPLDDIEVVVPDGGTGDVQVEVGDAGATSAAGGSTDVAHTGADDGGVGGAGTDGGDRAGSEGAGGGEQEEQLGVDLRIP